MHHHEPHELHRPANRDTAKCCMWVNLCRSFWKLALVRKGLGGWRVACLLITSLTVQGSRGLVFVDADEVSMISSCPSCPHAENLSAGVEFSLNDKGIIFSDFYSPFDCATTCRISLHSKAG